MRSSGFVILSSFDIRPSSFSQPLLENPHPVAEQDRLDGLVAKTPLDQPAGQAAAVRMFRQIGNKMRVREFLLKRDLLGGRKLPVDEFEKVEANGDAVDPNQITDMLDVVDVAIEGGFFLVRANEHGVDADDAAPRADHPDLLVRDIAFDVVKF